MTYSIIKQKKINPDLDMIERVLDKLNSIFDTHDVYWHSTGSEMFEFTYKKDSSKRETWQIAFMGKTVASGDTSVYDPLGFLSVYQLIRRFIWTRL